MLHGKRKRGEQHALPIKLATPRHVLLLMIPRAPGRRRAVGWRDAE